MNATEIARKMAALGQKKDAISAYSISLQNGGMEPSARLEAAVYILQNGGDYRISYTVFRQLYNEGFCQDDILRLMEKVFYEPNINLLKGRYERNCRRLRRYAYCFRKDFVPFEELPIRFFPYDDHNGYVPFNMGTRRFGGFVNVQDTRITRNFFKDLENPILAKDVFSQYELEYLNDNVRKSEWVARENHIYLHYTNWSEFCAWLQVLNMKPLVESEKVVFLIEDEIGQYPIDFKERFGIDYNQYTVKPVGIREVNRLIWHTQLSTHNGGDFFNEIFDDHPNLVVLPSVMMESVEKETKKIREILNKANSLKELMAGTSGFKPQLLAELYSMPNRADKDIMVATFLNMEISTHGLDPKSRIAPAIFFQPHFYNIVYRLRAKPDGRTELEAENLNVIHRSPIFKGFKYIKTFTPMRRFTTSHGATVKFMYNSSQKPIDDDGKMAVVSDAVSERVFNRSFMIDPEDRLYHDSILVRFEDGKLNPKATFTALAAFLDLPYTDTMTYCSEGGKKFRMDKNGKDLGMDSAIVYRTYDEYINDSERYFIEYFLRDAYTFYGYNFQAYDGAPVDEQKVEELIRGFGPINEYMRKTWINVYKTTKVKGLDGESAKQVEGLVQNAMLDGRMKQYDENRLKNAKILLEGLRFINKNGQPLYMMPMLKLDPALLENPIYH